MKMTMPILKELLQGYMNSLYEEGLVNDRFFEIQSLKSTREPDHVVQLIEKYFADVDMMLSELYCHIDVSNDDSDDSNVDSDDSNVDFSKLASLVREIENKSVSIGAEHMRLACSDLIKACDEENKRSFSRTVSWVKREFTDTRNKLGAFVQMERRIIRLESSQPPN